MYFSKKINLSILKVVLNGNQLHWVEKALNLGNTLTTQLSSNPLGMDTTMDLLQKRAIFFQKVHELKQAYGFYDPQIVCEVVRIFGTSFYGSPLWNLGSKEHLKLERSWNTMVKIIFDLSFQTHTRFIESLSKVPHLQPTLHGRYIGFIYNLNSSKKPKI